MKGLAVIGTEGGKQKGEKRFDKVPHKELDKPAGHTVAHLL